MFRKSFSLFVCVSALAMIAVIAASPANADIVQATTSNTTPSGAFTSGLSDVAGYWIVRSDVGSPATNVLESGGGFGDNPPTLTTTVSVPNGIYNVSVVWWSHYVAGNNDWRIEAAVPGSGMTLFQSSNVGAATTPTGLTYGSSIVEEASLLGQENVTNGSLSINVTNYGAGTGMDYRSWYEGVSYQLAPEPSAMMLFITGVLGLLAYAWRKRRCVPS